ncbi:MAG TPA: imelysin family protein [Leptospiraceae bacterium]|nr:imelysin family protein [Leptospiraceae bacterium]
MMIYRFIIIIMISFLYECRHSENSSKGSGLDGLIYMNMNSFNTEKMLSDTVENIILPEYRNLDRLASVFETSAGAYASGLNTAQLETLRSDWRNLQSALKNAELFNFGPAGIPDNYYIRLDFSAISGGAKLDVSGMNTVIEGSSPSSVSQNYIAGQGTKRGLIAAEKLLFDDTVYPEDSVFPDSASAVSSAFSSKQRRLDFLRSLSLDIKDTASKLIRAWEPSGGNYIQVFLGKTPDSKYFIKTDAVSELINQSVFLLEAMTDRKIGLPAGLSSSSKGIKNSLLVESKYRDNSLPDLLNNIQALRKLYTGKGRENSGSGISDYIKYYNPVLDARVLARILKTENQISKMNESGLSLRKFIDSDIQSVKTLYSDVKELRLLFAADIASALNVTGTASSSDGD